MRVFLIVNPVAGGLLRPSALQQAISQLQRHGALLTVEHTEAPGHATELARSAASGGHDLIVACGGDGTVSEVANGLAGSDVPMGVLPFGTVNIWASETGIPRNPIEAARVLLKGSSRQVDLGLVGSRHFLMMAGVGMDGAIAENLNLSMKRFLGRAAYVLTGIWTVAAFSGSPVELLVDGQVLEREAVWIVIGNTRLYGGVVTVTPHARVDDGLLDLCIFSGKSSYSALGYLIALLGGRHLSLKNVEYLQCKEVAVSSTRPLPIQADGDWVGLTPQTFRVASAALRVVLPSTQKSLIFSNSPHIGRAA